MQSVYNKPPIGWRKYIRQSSPIKLVSYVMRSALFLPAFSIVSWGRSIPIRSLPQRAYLSVACRWNQHLLACSATCRRNQHPFKLFSNLQAESTPVHLIDCLLPEPTEINIRSSRRGTSNRLKRQTRSSRWPRHGTAGSRS